MNRAGQHHAPKARHTLFALFRPDALRNDDNAEFRDFELRHPDLVPNAHVRKLLLDELRSRDAGRFFLFIGSDGSTRTVCGCSTGACRTPKNHKAGAPEQSGSHSEVP